jgi:phosphatidylinositol glycan class S
LTRRIILASIWSIVLFLGLPWWLWTTQIHRAELPLEAIDALKQSGALDLQFPVKFQVFVAGNLENIERELASKFKRWETVPSLSKGVNRITFKSSVSASHLNVNADDFEKGIPRNDRSDQAGVYKVYVFNEPTEKVYIGDERYIGIFASSNVVDKVASVLDSLFLQERDHLLRYLDDNFRGPSKSRTVKYSSRYQITLSMLVGDSDVCSWDIEKVTRLYLEPFFNQFRPHVDVDVVSQMQYAAALNVHPIERDGSYYLNPEQLPTFINSAEWNMATLDASGIPLNFILYCPSKSQSPLYLMDSKGNTIDTHAFLIPRWGGIAISNAAHCNLTLSELQLFAEIVVEQARKILGVQPLQIDVLHATATSPVGLTGWEMDRWIRKRTAENVVNAARTLTSLAKLISNMGNMVVMDDIRNNVQGSLDGFHETMDALKNGNSNLAFASSKRAVDLAESAFFDPTMVSMLYFPTEHRFAIYMPLFVPAAVPLLTATWKEWQDFKKHRRPKTD